jgi:lysozyme
MSEPNDIIKFFEQCRLTAYQDSGSIWTLAWGRTANVHQGDTCTQVQADSWLDEDIQNAITRVRGVITIPLQDFELSALTSQAYNLRSFEMLAAHLQNEGRAKYQVKSLLYCKDSQGITFNGLLIRRIAERLLFNNRYWKDIATSLQTKKSLQYTQSMIPKLFP